MGYALALTAIMAGGVLVYSGFRNTGIWDGFLMLVRQPVA